MFIFIIGHLKTSYNHVYKLKNEFCVKKHCFWSTHMCFGSMHIEGFLKEKSLLVWVDTPGSWVNIELGWVNPLPLQVDSSKFICKTKVSAYFELTPMLHGSTLMLHRLTLAHFGSTHYVSVS